MPGALSTTMSPSVGSAMAVSLPEALGLRVDQCLLRAAVLGLPGGDHGKRRLARTGLPGVQIGPWPDHAPADPPVARLLADRRDPEVQMAGAGVAGFAYLAQPLPSGDAYAGP